MSQLTPEPSLFLVDDDAGILRLAGKALRREGYAVATAASGAEALTWLQQHQPDLLLLDLKLQDSNARDIIAQLAKLKRLPRFLIITGQGDEAVAVEMMKLGALDYLVKDKDFLDHLPAVTRRALKEIEKEKKLATAELALRQSEERFRVAVKNSSIMVFNQDLGLRYTWISNPHGGRGEAHYLGKTDEEIYPEEEADRLTRFKLRVLATGAGGRQELPATLGANRRLFDLTVEPVHDERGKIIGLTGAALDITDRKRLEEEVLHISDLEQRRLGQDLHDGICQHLVGIELKCHVLLQNLQKSAPEQLAHAEKIAQHVRETILETRSLARSLSPFILESEGLVSGLQQLAENMSSLFNVHCRCVIEHPIEIKNITVATHLYRIAQEAVNNAIKHGKAREIEIRLTSQAGQVVLSVRDNGGGLSPKPSGSQGMGLRIMQYRAGIIGATLLFQGGQDGGTNVVCFFNAPTK